MSDIIKIGAAGWQYEGFNASMNPAGKWTVKAVYISEDATMPKFANGFKCPMPGWEALTLKNTVYTTIADLWRVECTFSQSQEVTQEEEEDEQEPDKEEKPASFGFEQDRTGTSRTWTISQTVTSNPIELHPLFQELLNNSEAIDAFNVITSGRVEINLNQDYLPRVNPYDVTTPSQLNIHGIEKIVELLSLGISEYFTPVTTVTLSSPDGQGDLTLTNATQGMRMQEQNSSVKIDSEGNKTISKTYLLK